MELELSLVLGVLFGIWAQINDRWKWKELVKARTEEQEERKAS